MMQQDRHSIGKPIVSKGSVIYFDYKDPDGLRRFMTERGNILPREKTGLSNKQQRSLALSIKRARHLALLPFVTTV